MTTSASTALRRPVELLRARALLSALGTRAKVLAALAVLAALYLLLAHELFTNLGGYWLRDYDESRHIANAMEMLRRNDWLVNTYRGTPDFWNLKPPASFWTIMLSVKAFGVSAFSVRLPSAIATLCTSLICTVVAWRWRGPLAAVVTTAAFGSSLHLVDLHSGRTADPDAVFVLFMTISVFCTVLAQRHPWAIVAATTFFSLAFLTKSYHAGLALVFLIGVVVVDRRHSALRPRHLLVALLGFVPLIAWAIARYQYDGLSFFRAMITTDVLARSESQIEGHVGGPEYYLTNLQVTFGPWALVFAAALVAAAGAATWPVIRRIISTSARGRSFVELCAWVGLVFLAFSAVASKLPWYTIPALPTLCVLIGVAVAVALTRVARPAGALILVACVAATWLGQISITGQRQMEQPTTVQLALSQLPNARLAPGQHIYVDPVVSGWQQSFVALVDMYSDAQMMDGNDAAYQSDTTRDPVILVQEGSAAYQSVMLGKPTVLVQYLDWKIVERTGNPER